MRYDREAVLDAWANGSTCRDIAKRLGLQRPESASVIIQRARQRGDARALLRPFKGGASRVEVKIDLSDPDWTNLIREATDRGVSAAELGKRLLRIVSAEGMISAVLDEAS